LLENLEEEEGEGFHPFFLWSEIKAGKEEARLS